MGNHQQRQTKHSARDSVKNTPSSIGWETQEAVSSLAPILPMIKTHKELANFIAGKRILHLNSFGKDSAVCLEWLANFAHPAHVVSVNFQFTVPHPGDVPYSAWQKKRYPNVEFIEVVNPLELGSIIEGVYQSPLDVITYLNECEHYSFDFMEYARNIADKYNCDYICLGHSKYESVTRATQMYKKGLVQGRMIYPIGMMTKEQVLGIIAGAGIKLHPVYKIAKSTIDHLSYYKMRTSFIVHPQYKRDMYERYPLLQLDEYRYEKLLKKK